ncbi:C1 family peptidase [Amnibacterium endophyticum]|uniref:C1 family peptidase n=1 Tax=Amnibacterium endophyticum TaxID=2109337 RepID=A0ABW4LB35_9MICO
MRATRDFAVVLLTVVGLLGASIPAQAASSDDVPLGRPGGGYLPPQDARPFSAAPATASDAELPESVDLTEWAVSPGDQGSVDSCVSWALTYTIAGFYANRLGTPTRLAPMYVYSQTHLSDSSGGGGSYVRDALSVLQQQGAATFAGYQPQGDYDFTTPPTTAQHTEAASYKMLGAGRLLFSSAGRIGAGAAVAIKTALAHGAPVGIAIPIYESFYELDATDSEFPLSKATGPNYGGHYVAALGYDSTGVWIENSWGRWWGRDGFAHLGWDFVNADAYEAEAVNGFAAATLPTPPASPEPTASPVPTPIASVPVELQVPDTTPVDPAPAPEPVAPAPAPVPGPVEPEPLPAPPAPIVQPRWEPTPSLVEPTTTAPVVQKPPVSTPTAPPPRPSTTAGPIRTPNLDAGATSAQLSLPASWRPTAGRSLVVRLQQPGRPWRVVGGNSTSRVADHLQPGTAYRLQVLQQQGRSSRVLMSRSFTTDRNPLVKVRARSTRGGLLLTWRPDRALAAQVHRYTVRVVRGAAVVRILHVRKQPAAAMSIALPRLAAGRYRLRVTAEVDAHERPSRTITYRAG